MAVPVNWSGRVILTFNVAVHWDGPETIVKMVSYQHVLKQHMFLYNLHTKVFFAVHTCVDK